MATESDKNKGFGQFIVLAPTNGQANVLISKNAKEYYIFRAVYFVSTAKSSGSLINLTCTLLTYMYKQEKQI